MFEFVDGDLKQEIVKTVEEIEIFNVGSTIASDDLTARLTDILEQTFPLTAFNVIVGEFTFSLNLRGDLKQTCGLFSGPYYMLLIVAQD